MGFQPKWRREEMPWMPKGRYKIMREYMPRVGSLGLDMMTRTCTVQVNLDVGSQADMVKKFRDRKSVVAGTRVAVRVDLGGRGIHKKKKYKAVQVEKKEASRQ